MFKGHSGDTDFEDTKRSWRAAECLTALCRQAGGPEDRPQEAVDEGAASISVAILTSRRYRDRGMTAASSRCVLKLT